MVKYYCDRCEKETKSKKLFEIVMWIWKERTQYWLCIDCIDEFRKLLKEFES